ncbi:type II toxin-antitoxin system VapC family toxin [Rhizobium sp. LjRoot98]|uniref:type II toxin-antitoxin system VapC family toxin n=1 Tax=unclassified Rhizobium TaxID=2613769 RepID=UPI00071437D7|nr:MULTISPECIES: type II toxin-antitoxin system VapC family toxin [unclassified Rhizobium]KQV40336.1 plasmid stabilization protein [Rhizobium sp. Root1204]KQY02699.1 plasmid stabilization protein [Rhizobium sp. Root1334]KRB99306.1 plasmid stabilization protein [Rhizobium sp. Root73]
MYLVDTSVISEAIRGAPEAVAWLRAQDSAAIYISVVTIGEIMRGIAQKQATDRRTAAHLAEWLRKLRHDHTAQILPVTDQVAVEWGRLAALRPWSDMDGLIAATAIVHDLVVVTRNGADFTGVGLLVVNPWDLA